MSHFSCAHCGSEDISMEHPEEIDFTNNGARLIFSCDDCEKQTCVCVIALERVPY